MGEMLKIEIILGKIGRPIRAILDGTGAFSVAQFIPR